MRASIAWAAVLFVGVLAIGALLSRVISDPVGEKLEEERLEEPVQKVGALDGELTRKVAERLGLKETAEREIDLYAPTEADIRFLMDTFRGADPAARKSAARALIVIQEPRAVGLFLRTAGTPEEQEYYCAGALEILRFKTAEQAAELMVDALEDSENVVDEGCREELGEKLSQIMADVRPFLDDFLTSDRRRVRRFALERLPEELDETLVDPIERLAGSKDAEERRLADRWLTSHGYVIDATSFSDTTGERSAIDGTSAREPRASVGGTGRADEGTGKSSAPLGKKRKGGVWGKSAALSDPLRDAAEEEAGGDR